MSLVPKTEFIGGDGRAYLVTAGEGLVPKTVLDATRRYYENRVAGKAGWTAHEAVIQSCRVALAGLMNAEPDDIALLGSTSEGINAVYSLIDWQPGDNIVLATNELEFPSVVLPAVKRERDGLDVRVVEHDGYRITPERIGEAMDDRTRLVFVSHVSYRTGYRFDLQALSEVVFPTNAILAVDATQAVGVVPFDARFCDFAVVTSCKWLLAPHGIGVFYWNRRRRPDIEPAQIGWYSVVDDLQFPYELKPDADRFATGGPNLPAIYGLEAGLEILTGVGVGRIQAHVDRLVQRLLDGLRDLDLEIMTPDDPERRAGIVSWVDPDCRATADLLAAEGIVVTGSSGRVRASIHLYNDENDIDRLIEAMHRLPVVPARR